MPLRVRLAGAAIRQHGAELALAACLLAGWLAAADGMASLVDALPVVGSWHLRRVVWRLAVAALCFSLAGWTLLGRLARQGLYALTREPKVGP